MEDLKNESALGSFKEPFLMGFFYQLIASHKSITSFVDKPVRGRNENLQSALCSQDDPDGETQKTFLCVVEPHADHIVLSARRNQQLFAHWKALQQDSLK